MMRSPNKLQAIFAVSLLLSALAHAAVIRGVSVPGIAAAGLFAPKLFFADIINEDPFTKSSSASSRKSESRRPRGGPSGESASKQIGAAKGEAITRQEQADGGQVEQVVAVDQDVSGKGVEEAVAADVRRDDELLLDEAGMGQPTIPAEGQPLPVGKLNYPLNCTKEMFSFDIYWLGVYVGKATMEAVNDAGTLKITSQVHSAPLISTFYKVEDYAESRIVRGMPSHFRIKQHEGRYRSDKETIFDADAGRVIFMNYLKGTRTEHDIAEGVLWDVISGFYYLRTQFFEIGKTVYVDIFDSNKILKAEVDVIKKDKVNMAGKGDVGAVVVKPVLKSDGLFQHKGDILIWLTDDESRIPVRVETKVPIGTVVAELKEFETK